MFGLTKALLLIAQELKGLRMDLTALTTAVTNETTVEQSAVTLITNLAAELKNTAGDQNAVNALADQINASAKALGDAVAANTPAAPAP